MQIPIVSSKNVLYCVGAASLKKMRIQVREEIAATELESAYIERRHLASTLVLFEPRILLRNGGVGCGHDMHACPHPEKSRTAKEAATIIGLTIMNVALPKKLSLPPAKKFCRLAFKL